MSKQFGVTYPWDDETRAIARRFDFIARAPELIAHSPNIAIQCVTGADDGEYINQPAAQLRDALLTAGASPDRLEWTQIENQKHAFAEEPGLESAPQNVNARRIDAAVSQFLLRALS